MVLLRKLTVTRAGISRVLCFKRSVGFSESARHALHHTIQAQMYSWNDLIAHLGLSSVATWKCVWLTGMSTFRILWARIGPLHPSTGFTPNILMFGRESSGLVDLLFPIPKVGQGPSVPEYVVSKQERLVECYNLAREHLRAAAERQKRDHDTRVLQNKFQPGDLVWKWYHVRKKLERPWVGPYVIRKVLSDCLYLMSDKKSTYALHHDLLKPYTSTHVPRWAQMLRATC